MKHIKHWYEKQPKKARGFAALTEAYDEKYGDYNYTHDSRAIDHVFERTLLKACGSLAGKYVLVCGANSGHEIEILREKYPTARFVAVDIALEALKKLPPDVSRVHASMDALPFRNRAFDVYINCRSIQSSGVNMVKAIGEAKRVTKGRIVITIPNGYLVEGKIVNGIYDYVTGSIDPKKPETLTKAIAARLKVKRETRSEGEIFLIA